MALDFGMFGSNLFPESDVSGQGMTAEPSAAIVWNDVGIGIIPVGGVVAWLKSLTGCPPLLPNFVECNGQVLTDGDSPFNGQTIPDLNASAGTARFLRGSTTSGAIGGSETHSHTLHKDTCSIGSIGVVDSNSTGLTSTLPSYYAVVWIMRIK